MASAIIDDDKGRKLEVSQVDVVTRMRLMRALGKAADIDRYMGHALLAACVRSIDGVPIVAPSTAEQCDALIAKVDMVGLAAVAGWLDSLGPVEIDRDHAKN
jgi:hypothetical protein